MEKKFGERSVDVDAEGFLTDWQAWNQEIAADIAKEEGIAELNENHWKVLNYMRKVFGEKGDGPTIRALTKESGVDTKLLYQLFPGGPAKKAAKIAGIPKPHGCI